jgi:oligopeptidase A
MSAESTTSRRQECLSTIDDELTEMARRLRVIIAESNPPPDSLSEIATIYSNVAHIFVYLEGNERHLDYEPLLRHRDGFFADRELCASAFNTLSRLACLPPEAEDTRQIWMAWFRERAQAPGLDVAEKLEGLQQSAKQVLHGIQEDQAKLLERLGVSTGTASPATVFYRIVSETKKLDTRRKLAQAWNMQRDRRTHELANFIDQTIRVRRRQAEEKGFGTVLEQTFERCSVSRAGAHALITTYLSRALDRHSRLAANISSATGCADSPMDHFGRFLRSGLTGSSLPMFPLDGCLDFAFTVASRVFGVTVTRVEGENSRAVKVAVDARGQRLGAISFDLLDTGRRGLSTNGLSEVVDRRDQTGVVLQPASHVLCKFQRGAEGTRLLTFESAHISFHEFGHALNHLLLRKRLPSQSGLDYLPAERLEDLSSWFEKWVFHPDFATHLSMSGRDEEGLAQCRRVKMLEFHRTNLERAVAAALDFEVHGRTEGGIMDSFEELDRQFTISDHCPFGDLLETFTAPVFRANPGASFVYLWGAAYGAQSFAPFYNLRIEDVRPGEQIGERLNSCFDPDEPSTEPVVQAVFDFYDAVL